MTQQPFKAARLAAIFMAPLLLSACATGPVGPDAEPAPPAVTKPFSRDSNWALRLPEVETVLYQGVVNHDKAGIGTGSLLYPAPHVLGFVAALVTHGVINETMKSKQKSKLQEDADKVLVPYQTVLAGYRYQELMQQGLGKLPAAAGRKLMGHAEKPVTEWSIDSVPVYSMTQDQSAIVLDNVISVYPSRDRSAPAYQNIVRVVSQPRSGTDHVNYWSAENGRKLKEESVGMFAESLDIALNDAANAAKPNSNVHKTFRYYEGETERMERAQLISERCDRAVIKTLRGAPMSIPVRRDAANPCVQASSTLK